MSFRTAGIHHVTGIASDPQRNLDFYAGILGLRLVKRTVNFDDPTTYHFYFGDESGSPGSILTFFPWPDARRGRQGGGQVAVTSFSCLLYTSDAADDLLCVDLGGRRIIKKKKKKDIKLLFL